MKKNFLLRSGLCLALSLGAITIALTPAISASETNQQSQQFADISIEDLKKHMAAGTVTIIDCLPYGMYQNNHVPGATHFRDARKVGLETVLPADKNALVVTYCGGPG
jgi:hypothetical protein